MTLSIVYATVFDDSDVGEDSEALAPESQFPAYTGGQTSSGRLNKSQSAGLDPRNDRSHSRTAVAVAVHRICNTATHMRELEGPALRAAVLPSLSEACRNSKSATA